VVDDFELPDQDGKPWRLGEALGRGPLLLIFFRGDW
jgi:peroxiredoxin